MTHRWAPDAAAPRGRHGGRYSERVARQCLDTLRWIVVQGRRGITVDELVEHIERSRASIYRDLATIRAAGWDLRVSHDRRDANRAYYWIGRVRT